MMPLVSICMPAYNAAKYLDETIHSILGQTYPAIELIICNDGSTDDTEKVLSKFATNSKIKIIHTTNRGQCASANEAYHHAKGDFIKFFDADDLMNPEHISEQVQILLNNPDCIAAGQIKRFYNDDISTALHEPLVNWKDLKPMDWLINGNGHGLGMMQCGMFLIPRHFLSTAGIWNESLSQINDFEFFPRVLLQANEILFTKEAKVYYRSGIPNSLSNDLSHKKLQSAYTALEITTHRLLEYEDSERVRKVLAFYWNLWMYHFFLDDSSLYKGAKLYVKKLGKYSRAAFKGSWYSIPNMIGWKNHKRIVFIKKRFRKFI